MKNVHLIQHTHWDREWYFTENDSHALLYYFMDDLMTRLEADSQIGPFVLDAQIVILDDYLEIAPESKQRLEKLIQQGRILIGPWYTQTDFLVVGAESIARNLLLGILRGKQHGPVMMVGYIPDSFGQCAQLPMFLQQFGINSTVFWRGWSEEFVKHTEFRWQSDDGSEVSAAVLPWGYGCAKWLPIDADEAHDKVMAACDKQSRFAATNNIMLPNGNDQSPFEYQIPEMLLQLNNKQNDYHFSASSFDQFFAAIEPKRQTLALYRGELISPKYMRIHRGIFSTRMDIKLANVRLEKLLSQQLEPLLTVNWQLGLPYPTQAVDKIWLEAMKSHAHDSIGACNSDRVNQMAWSRLQSGIEMAEQLLDLNLRKLCQGIKAQQEGTKIVLFNSLPRQRSGLVSLTICTPAADFAIIDATGHSYRYQIMEEGQQDMATVIQDLTNQPGTMIYRRLTLLAETPDIPACGYLVLYLQENKKGEQKQVIVNQKQANISNQWLSLSLASNNKLQLTDKRNQVTYADILQLVDGGDDGDNYNYSPPAADWLIFAEKDLQNWQVVQSELVNKLILNYSLAVPSDLSHRDQKVANARLAVTLTLSLPLHAAQLEIDISVDNQVNDHRLQLYIPTGLTTKQHYADQQFGLICRDNKPAEMALWQQQGWTETPAALYPMQSLVAINDGQKGLAVITNGIREYEIPQSESNSLAITLYRSVGWLGKKDLVYRPGRASGMVIPAPDSQLHGQIQFSLCLIPQTGDMQQPAFWQQVDNWRVSIIHHVDTRWPRFRLNAHNKEFPSHFSLLEWDSPLCFSCLKKAQQQDAIVIRSYNPATKACLINKPVTEQQKTAIEISVSNLAEQQGELFDTAKHTQVSACAPVTLLLAKKGG